jgi:hypothetical protein
MTSTQQQQQQPKLSDAVEMDTLPAINPSPTATTDTPAVTSTSNVGGTTQNTDPAQLLDKTLTTSQPSAAESETAAGPSSKSLGKAPVSAEDDPLAIAPAEAGALPTPPPRDGDLAVDIMLIATSSNSRHPFRINEKYLTKRNVNVTGVTEDGKMDPFSITVYTLKELILRDWRSDWEAPPREPTSIRLIFFGKLLEDKLPLNRM